MLTHQFGQRRRAVRTCRPDHETSQTNKEACTRKRRRARVRRHDHPPVPSTSGKRCRIQVVDKSRHLRFPLYTFFSISGGDEFASQHLFIFFSFLFFLLFFEIFPFFDVFFFPCFLFVMVFLCFSFLSLTPKPEKSSKK